MPQQTRAHPIARAVQSDVHPMFAVLRRHGRLTPQQFVALAAEFRRTPGDDVLAERLLATYVPLISAMVKRKQTPGEAGLQYRDGAIPSAIAAFFEAIGDAHVPLAPRPLHNAINERITRALEHEQLQAEHALVVSAQSAWRAANVVRTAASVSGEEVAWLTRDEVYAILGDSIRVESVHLVQSSRRALSLLPSAGADGGAEAGAVPLDTVAPGRSPESGAAALAAERIARALATLPAADARLIVDAHGLFGRKAISSAEAATNLGVHPGTYRRMLVRAEGLLRGALERAHPELAEPDAEPDGTRLRMPGAWCSATAGRDRKAYQDALDAGRGRYAQRAAAAVRRFAEHEGWTGKEREAAVRRLVSYRTGKADSSEHPLTLEIIALLNAPEVAPAADSAAEPAAASETQAPSVLAPVS